MTGSGQAGVLAPYQRRTGWLDRIAAADRRAVRRVAGVESVLFDRVLPALSEAANHSRLWAATAAAMAVVGDREGRRAALRGLAAVALASTTVNVVVKGVSGRNRPHGDAVPPIRRLRRQPVTSSFPSGHTASAAAFSLGVALESRRLAVPVAVLAAGVGASRVVTGAHYPSDVLAGAAIGALAGAATLRWWPLEPDVPAASRRFHAAHPLERGQGLVVVRNSASGDGDDETVRQLRELLPDAEVVDVPAGGDLDAVLADAARRARALGVAGGDGTVGAAAAVAADAGLPLAVFPAGTLNHFARDVGLETVADTAAAVRTGHAVCVDLVLADEHAFVNTFSTGVYVDLVRARERLERRIGKWPALAVGLAHVLRTAQPHLVVVNGHPRRLWLLFAGNCTYTPAGFAPAHRPRLDDGLLDVRIVGADRPFARSRLLAAVLLGTVSRSRVYETAQVPALWLEFPERAGPDQAEWRGRADRMPIAVDGEVLDARSGFAVRKHPQRLVVYRPRIR